MMLHALGFLHSGLEKINSSSLTDQICLRLIDLDYYADQAGQAFTDRKSALAHFINEGQALNLNPSPFFYTEWYRWHNSIAKFTSSLHHFVECTSSVCIDPAPFIDSTKFLIGNPAYISMVEALIALTEKRNNSISKSLDDHLLTLSLQQRTIQDAIRSGVIRMQSTARKRLVWVQSGPGFSTTQWFRPDAPRSWDLMCNWYSLQGMDLRHGEVHLRQSGTKATAIHHVLQTAPELLLRYDQVLFLDDDLQIAHSDIDLLFDTAEGENLDLFQPALIPGSHCVWPDLFRKSNTGVRRTTGVEIMMPGFSRRALADCTQFFGRSVSGFGLDFLFSEHLRCRGMKSGVVDAVGVGHYAPIDEAGGTFYRFIRALGINQKLELYALSREIGAMPEFRELTPDEQYTI